MCPQCRLPSHALSISAPSCACPSPAISQPLPIPNRGRTAGDVMPIDWRDNNRERTSLHPSAVAALSDSLLTPRLRYTWSNPSSGGFEQHESDPNRQLEIADLGRASSRRLPAIYDTSTLSRSTSVYLVFLTEISHCDYLCHIQVQRNKTIHHVQIHHESRRLRRAP